MATDHYTRLGIEKEKFDGLDEKGKEELVKEQFKKIALKGLTGFILTFFPKLLVPKKIQLLESARDILKDDKMREHYNYFVDSKVITENITYSELEKNFESLKLKADSISGKENLTVDYNNNQSQEEVKNNNTKPLSLEEQIEQKKKELGKIKDGRETQKYDVTNKIKEFNELNSQSKQSKKEVGQQAEFNASNIEKNTRSNAKTPVTISVTQNLVDRHDLLNTNKVDLNSKSAPLKPLRLNMQIQQQEGELAKMEARFHEGLKEAGIDIKGRNDKEIQNELRYMGTLPLQFENILNKKGELLELNNKRAEIDKLNHEPKPNINNNIQGKFAQQISQRKETSEQQKGNGRSI